MCGRAHKYPKRLTREEECVRDQAHTSGWVRSNKCGLYANTCNDEDGNDAGGSLNFIVMRII